MKKIIAISLLSLVFSPSFAQDVTNNTLFGKLDGVINKIADTRSKEDGEPIKVETIPVVNTTIESKEISEAPKPIEKLEYNPIPVEAKIIPEPIISEPAVKEEPNTKEEPKKAIKKIIHKKKKSSSQPVVLESNAILLDSGYYSVPKNLNAEQEHKLEQKISYANIDLKFEKNNENISVSLTDNRLSLPLDSSFISGNISAFSVSTDLAQIKNTTISYNSNQNIINLNNNDTCQVVYFTYKLKTLENSNTVTQYIDAKGNIVSELPQKCISQIVENKINSFYSESNVIANIGYNQNLISKHKLAFTLHFSKEGKEFSPSNLQILVINKDFSTAYSLLPKSNSKGSYYGITANKELPVGNYNVLVGYDSTTYEWLKSNISIQ